MSKEGSHRSTNGGEDGAREGGTQPGVRVGDRLVWVGDRRVSRTTTHDEVGAMIRDAAYIHLCFGFVQLYGRGRTRGS